MNLNYKTKIGKLWLVLFIVSGIFTVTGWIFHLQFGNYCWGITVLLGLIKLIFTYEET